MNPGDLEFDRILDGDDLDLTVVDE